MDEILNLIESVSEGFPSYFFTEYCLKYTLGGIVWMQPTSVCDSGESTQHRRAFAENDVRAARNYIFA